MQLEASTLGVTQRALQRRSDLPTRPVRSDVDQVPYPPIGGISLSDFPPGFFPGWLLLASFPSVPKIISITSPQVSPLSSPLLVPLLIGPRGPISCHERWISRVGRILSCPDRPKCSVSQSQSISHQVREQDGRRESIDIPSANVS